MNKAKNTCPESKNIVGVEDNLLPDREEREGKDGRSWVGKKFR